MYFDIQDQLETNFNKMDEIMKLTKTGRILIAADTNSRSKTWYAVITNTRGKKLEVYLAGTQLHIINEERERSTFHISIGFSNIDLTIVNNNLLNDVRDWEISAEESLSDHNYLQLKISMQRDKTYTHKTKHRSAKHVIKEEKLQVFDGNLVQEMQKRVNMTNKEGGADEIDNFLSTVIATGNDLEQNIELMEEAIQTACRRTFKHSHTVHKKNEEISPVVDGRPNRNAKKSKR